MTLKRSERKIARTDFLFVFNNRIKIKIDCNQAKKSVFVEKE